jgi:hypothetical protein
MLMPEATVNEHDLAVSGENNIWTARQVAQMRNKLESALFEDSQHL